MAAKSSWRLYIVRCADGSLYTGISNRLAERIRQHNRGQGAKYTRSRGPVELVWSRRVNNRSRASQLERWVKMLSKKDREKLVQDGWSVIPSLRQRDRARRKGK